MVATCATDMQRHWQLTAVTIMPRSVSERIRLTDLRRSRHQRHRSTQWLRRSWDVGCSRRRSWPSQHCSHTTMFTRRWPWRLPSTSFVAFQTNSVFWRGSSATTRSACVRCTTALTASLSSSLWRSSRSSTWFVAEFSRLHKLQFHYKKFFFQRVTGWQPTNYSCTNKKQTHLFIIIYNTFITSFVWKCCLPWLAYIIPKLESHPFLWKFQINFWINIYVCWE